MLLSPDRVPSARLPARSASRRRTRSVAALLIVAATLVAVRAFVATPIAVSGDSMDPTVGAGDVALVSRLAHTVDALRRGDLVVFRDPEGTLSLKRVVGLPGDRLMMLDSVLLVNDRPVDERYVDHATIDGTYLGRIVVPAGHVYVMGDNRARSIDSREYGAIDDESIVGRVLLHW